MHPRMPNRFPQNWRGIPQTWGPFKRVSRDSVEVNSGGYLGAYLRAQWVQGLGFRV